MDFENVDSARRAWRSLLGRFAILTSFVVTALVFGMPESEGQTTVPATIRIPHVKPHPRGTPAADAEFSHRSHSGLQCYACHPSTFPQARKGFTHADMREGRFCASCHDGETATAVTRFACESCHVP